MASSPEHICSTAIVSTARSRADAKVSDNILDVIGHTPLVKLNRIPKDHGLECEIYAKCEFQNPGGSIKDRMAYAMVVDAEDQGRTHEGTRFVEPTSGNTGIGIALTAAMKEAGKSQFVDKLILSDEAKLSPTIDTNPRIAIPAEADIVLFSKNASYKATIVTPDKNSEEKLCALRLLGADIVQTPASAKPGDPDHFITVALRIVSEDPKNNICLNQFSNEVNPLTHEEHTGREIVDALGSVDMVVMGAGTGGTVTGVGRCLKRACPDCIIVAVDPIGSLIWGKELVPFLVEGIGDDCIPKVLDKCVVNMVLKTKDSESFNMAREIIRKEGLLCGGSSGAAMVAAVKAAKERGLGAGKKVVVVLPDGIRNYMTKFVCDQWMEAHLFKEPPLHDKIEWWNHKLTNLVVTSVPQVKDSTTCRDVLAAMASVHSVAIVIDDNRLFVGAISKNQLRHDATNPKKEGNLDLNEPVKKHLILDCFKVVENAGDPTVGLVSRMMDITSFVVKVEKIPNPKSHLKEIFIPKGIITSHTVWQYILDHLDHPR